MTAYLTEVVLFRNDSKETTQPRLISEYYPLNKTGGHGLLKSKSSQELLCLVILGSKPFSWGSWSFICPVIKHLIESHLENFNLIFKEVIKYEYWWAPWSHCFLFQWAQWSPVNRRGDYHIFQGAIRISNPVNWSLNVKMEIYFTKQPWDRLIKRFFFSSISLLKVYFWWWRIFSNF